MNGILTKGDTKMATDPKKNDEIKDEKLTL